MNKWLQASRLRLGGKFPRKGAQKATELYLNKLKHRPLGTASSSKILLAHSVENEVPQYDNLTVSTASAAMIKKWLNDAKDNSKARFDIRSHNIRSELKSVLNDVTAEDDWYFGSELRLKGGALNIEGDQILKEKKARDKQVSKQVQALKLNLDEHIQLCRQKQQSRREELEQRLVQIRNESKARKDQREVELNRTLDERPDAEESLREQYSLEVKQEDELLDSSEINLRKETSSFIDAIERDITSATLKNQIDSQTLIERNRVEYVSIENNWRKNVSSWIGLATKKIEAKSVSTRREPD